MTCLFLGTFSWEFWSFRGISTKIDILAVDFRKFCPSFAFSLANLLPNGDFGSRHGGFVELWLL